MKKTFIIAFGLMALTIGAPQGVMANPTGQSVASAEQIIQGTVTDTNGEPLIGATIILKGTNQGITTDIDGHFSMKAAFGQELVISYVGYEETTVRIDSSNLDITLKDNAQALDEVVVVGYGTSKKKDLTGSVSSVRAKDLNTVSSSSVSQMLQGKVAGMSAIQSSAQPGAGISVTIRGAASPSGSNSPLYVIDGVPLQSNSTADPGIQGIDYKTGVDRDPLNTINPNDIESIEVLKDASAAAIYGASAANGVILITTKSGNSGKPKVDFRSVVTTQIKKDYPEVLNAHDFREQANLWSREYYLYNNKMGVYGPNAIDYSNYSPIFSDVNGYTADTNWLDEVTRTGYIVDENLSINGGTDHTKYFFSYNYYYNQGMLMQSDMQRHSIRLNLDQDFSNKLTGGIRMNYSNLGVHSTSVGAAGNGDNMLLNAFRFAPDMPIKDENGQYTHSYNQLINNPMGFSEIEDYTKTERVFVAPTLEFKILSGLSVKAVGGYDSQQSTRKFYIPASANQTGAAVNDGFGNLGYSKVENLSAEAFFNFNKEFGNHRISAVLGAGWYKMNSNGFGLYASNFFTDAFGVDNIGIASDKDREGIRSWRSERTKLSQFARLNYALMDRYLFTITARRDGSSYFAENNKWGFFPSASIGWRISEEPFMKDRTAFSNLKLRVGYGATGNENVLGTNSLSLYTSGYGTLIGNSVNTGFMLTQAANPDLKWETDYTLNLGIDFGLFHERLRGTVEVYHRGVKDLLDYQQLPANNAVGRVAANIGETKSEGFEVTINSNNIVTPKFNWETSLNISYSKASWVKRNPEVELAEYIGDTDEIDAIYGWETAGIITCEADIPSYMPDANIGNIKYVDQNGDGVLDSKDVVKLGNSTPRWVVGLGNTLSIGNFDLNFYWYGSFGNKKWRGQVPDAAILGNNGAAPGNTYVSVMTDVWNSQTGTGWMPGIASNPYSGNNPSGCEDFYLMDGSYIKLKNVTLGYNLPSSVFLNSNFIKSVRLFVDAQNICTITPYKGFDPELGTDNPYPQALSLSFGVNIGF
ncbi:MAG: TonB-dependent receptor [Bacteroidales bacterium]|nr:TonB-dependent receptor [Bacteroidales bacterium]